MNGIVVAKALGMTYPPSRHYGGTIGGPVDGVSVAFGALVGKLIDGEKAKPSGKLEIYAVTRNDEYARVVACDRTEGAEKCFVIDIKARKPNDGLGAWDKKRPNPPKLLDDILKDGVWQLYNCTIVLREWGRDSAFRRVFP
jgi:hypothetical protein